eukprot:2584410-Pleurochrysis_carterae.AAC.1
MPNAHGHPSPPSQPQHGRRLRQSWRQAYSSLGQGLRPHSPHNRSCASRTQTSSPVRARAGAPLRRLKLSSAFAKTLQASVLCWLTTTAASERRSTFASLSCCACCFEPSTVG